MKAALIIRLGLGLLLVGTGMASARKWQVGPSRPYTMPSAVASLVGNGDTVEIDSATYRDVCSWWANDLLIKGAGGRPRLDATGMQIAEGKAIWVLKGRSNTVEDIEFMGAACIDQNGAGIRIEGPGLVVRRGHFHDNENGILGGADSTSDIIIEYSEFGNNGYGDGYSHNMYIGNIRSFTLQHCYSHHARVGHLVKSRAKNNYIFYNRLTCETGGTSSYEVDLPNGGLSRVIGNLIHQGANTSNSTVISYGREGISAGYDTTIYLVNNTLVNDRSPFGSFLSQQAGTRAVLYNNVFYGGTRITSGGYHRGSNNWLPAGFVGADSLRRSVIGTNPRLKDLIAYDYRLDSTSACIDSGVDPGGNLLPQFQYVHSCSREARLPQGAIDIGAYEYVRTEVSEEEIIKCEKQGARLKIVPNPFISYASIPGHENDKFRVFDVTGRLVDFYWGDRIGADLIPGAYFVISTEGGSRPIRVVKIQ